MKKLILVSLFIFPFFISAQNYIPIPCDSTSEWRVMRQSHTKDPCLDVEDLRYFFNGDTIINTFIYKRLYKTGIYYQFPAGPNANCNTTVHHFQNNYVGAIRNDSGKVYFTQQSNYPEILLYNFTLIVGDTVPGYFYSQGDTIVSIDSVLINNYYQKRFNLDNNHWIIEGIGSDLGLIESLWSNFETLFQFLCYAENHTPIFPAGISCILNVNIEDDLHLKNKKLKIFPNPATDKLKIEFFENSRQQNLNITIYNSIGVKVKTFEAKNYFEVDIKDLKSGIYFIQIQSENKAVYNSKFIKL